jgi:hypothetical protein
MKSSTPFTENLAVVARDIGNGFFEITHSSFALLGLAVMFAAITVVAQPDIRQAGEVQLMTWLQDRQEVISGLVSGTPAERATAISLKELPKSQAALAQWLGRKYNRAPEAIGALVEEAFESGNRARIDPHLILAVMAVESGFNPFSQSPVGAQGLMQVMTHIHIDKFESYGGKMAVFDPRTNIKIGVQILKECISRAGSIEGGLRLYVGAGNMDDDNGYAEKVIAEQGRLQAVSAGTPPPINALAQTNSSRPENKS